ncbi:MAG TPA: hypothetical protein VIJ86_10085 [Acidimicrobiales bacterium]
MTRRPGDEGAQGYTDLDAAAHLAVFVDDEGPGLRGPLVDSQNSWRH